MKRMSSRLARSAMYRSRLAKAFENKPNVSKSAGYTLLHDVSSDVGPMPGEGDSNIKKVGMLVENFEIDP